ncbi:MAG: hypothetical protein BWY89_01490 [Bacteroidetes bacterium ADurb.BinA012]|nr:MAG: hypothetical protein BWY89_01490 [Bacteroidetes bacterium ADurb.BinA012]
MFAKESIDGFYLSYVTKRGGSAVNIDIVNVRGFQTGFIDSLFHHVDSSYAVRVRSSNMIGVSCEAGTCQLCIDACAPGPGMAKLL